MKEAAQSGWTQTWELIVGDFDQAKELFTGISDSVSSMLNASADRRNNLLEGALTTNWEKLISKINEAGIETSTFEEKLKATVSEHGIAFSFLFGLNPRLPATMSLSNSMVLWKKHFDQVLFHLIS